MHSEETKRKISEGQRRPESLKNKRLAIAKYWRDVRSGKKPKPERKGRPSKPIADRFWPKVAKGGDNECWIFTSTKGGGDYGMLSAPKGEEYLAHRVSWIIHNGAIPEGLKVLHQCDTPKCVNPSHLFLGTVKDNSDDKVRKKRHGFGQTHPMTLFTEETVLNIRKEYSAGGVSQQSIATRHGVNQTTISHIITRRTWKHI